MVAAAVKPVQQIVDTVKQPLQSLVDAAMPKSPEVSAFFSAYLSSVLTVTDETYVRALWHRTPERYCRMVGATRRFSTSASINQFPQQQSEIMPEQRQPPARAPRASPAQSPTKTQADPAGGGELARLHAELEQVRCYSWKQCCGEKDQHRSRCCLATLSEAACSMHSPGGSFMDVPGCSQQEHFAAIARCAATELAPQAQRRTEALAAEATSAKETAGHELALMRRQLSHAQSALAAAEKVQLWPPKAAEGLLQLRLWAVPEQCSSDLTTLPASIMPLRQNGLPTESLGMCWQDVRRQGLDGSQHDLQHLLSHPHQYFMCTRRMR